ncbi:hypothetical protein RB195_017720 [Necator americanus]|uniref:Proteasome subunit beta type-3 n=1 Tax=Necator americanus TaxID=51031 RepID=A0ABR1C8B7_NECAM
MSIMSYNGGTILAMAGNECICIASDLRIGEQMTTVAVDQKKVHKIADKVYKNAVRTSRKSQNQARRTSHNDFKSCLSTSLCMDTIGCIASPKDFVAVGTGQEYLLGVCESFWRENMNPEELFEATAQSMLSCLERDAASGWGVVIYTITKDKVNISTLKGRMD